MPNASFQNYLKQSVRVWTLKPHILQATFNYSSTWNDLLVVVEIVVKSFSVQSNSPLDHTIRAENDMVQIPPAF